MTPDLLSDTLGHGSDDASDAWAFLEKHWETLPHETQVSGLAAALDSTLYNAGI